MKYSKKVNNKDFMELYNMYNFYKVNEGEDSDVVYGIVRTLKVLKIYDDILFYDFLQSQPYTVDKIHLEDIKQGIEKIYNRRFNTLTEKKKEKVYLNWSIMQPMQKEEIRIAKFKTLTNENSRVDKYYNIIFNA